MIMKTTIFFCIGILLQLYSGSVSCREVTEKGSTSSQEVIQVMSTPDLHELVSKWVHEYSSLNPEVKINIIQGNPDNTFLKGDENIGFISNDPASVISFNDNWNMAVGREVIVPVINAGNPLLSEILKTGISQPSFARIIGNMDKKSWGTLVASGNKIPVHLYMVDDGYLKDGVTRFLGVDKIPEGGFTIGSRDDIVKAIQNDPYALGFCKIIQIMGNDNQKLVDNIRLLPIDKNNNGSLEYMEDIYGDPEMFLRGVWIGKYIKALYSNVYAVRNVKPIRESDRAFLSWIVSDGQQYMKTSGFSGLVRSESQSQLSKINAPLVSTHPAPKVSPLVSLMLFILTVGLITVLAILFAKRLSHRKKQADTGFQTFRVPVFNENAVVVPQGLYFDKSHTWAFMEKDGSVTIGIDDFLQHVTGPITRIEMKNQGEKIKKGALLLTLIQSGKQLNIYAPVSGTIQKKNETLALQSSYLNLSPYGDGWVYRIDPSRWYKEIQLLEIAEKYSIWLSNEFTRFKDFLAQVIKPDDPEYSPIVLQDGGELKDGVLADFGPEIWEEFQTRFIDTFKITLPHS
jgi:glycine cleavage system H lipoate-binding protein